MNVHLVFATSLLWAASRSIAAVRLLKCNSVNQVSTGGQTEFVFISTKKDACVFIFEGPEGSQLDIEVRSVTFPHDTAAVRGCGRSKLTVYNYVDSKIVLGKLLCDGSEKTNVLTKSNMGVVTSGSTDGSFSLRIRPILPSDDESSSNEISGMLPPKSEAKDYFFIEHRSSETDGGFKPLVLGGTEDFKPSVALPPDTSDEVEVIRPTYANQEPGRHYPGRPTAHVDLTYNSTGLNFTISSPRPHRPWKPGHNQTTPNGQLESTTGLQPSTVSPASNGTVAFRPTIPTTTPASPSSATSKPPSNEPTDEE